MANSEILLTNMLIEKCVYDMHAPINNILQMDGMSEERMLDWYNVVAAYI